MLIFGQSTTTDIREPGTSTVLGHLKKTEVLSNDELHEVIGYRFEASFDDESNWTDFYSRIEDFVPAEYTLIQQPDYNDEQIAGISILEDPLWLWIFTIILTTKW